jgi:hypothetical protein
MKKIIAIIFLLINSFLSAQTEQRSIDLPDFVITGKQSVQIPTATKRKPDFVSTISQEFLLPQYSPEELPLLISSEATPEHPDINSLREYYNSSLKIQIGRYSLPVGEFNLNQSFGSYLVSAKVWGSNIKEYIPNAGFNTSGVSLSNDFFFSTKSDFLTGAKLKLYADYSRNSYKLFGTIDPTFLRETSNGNALFSLSSSYNRWVSYGFDLGGNILTMDESGFKETNINMKGSLEFKVNDLSLGGSGYFTKQILEKNISQKDGATFVSVEGFAKLFPSSSVFIKVGADYSNGASENCFSPFGSVEYKIDNGFTAFVEYKPHAEFINATNFLRNNVYLSPGIIDNVFSKYKTNISGLFKYEYEKIFSISLEAGYSNVSNYFYFEDIVNRGKFDLLVLPEVSISSAGFNLIIYPNGYGYFLGDIKLKSAKSSSGNFITYEPKVSSMLTYGYDFANGFGFKLQYQLAFDTFTDMANTNKLDNFHNVSIVLNYEILRGLKLTADFQNILNRTNFVWKQYQEKLFDVLFGIEYRW